MLSFVPVSGVHPKDLAHRHKGQHEDSVDFRSPTLPLALTRALALTLPRTLPRTLALTRALALTLGLILPLC